MRNKAKKEGFTLLELMFAVGILAGTLSLLFGSLLSVSLAGGITEDRAVAVTHLSSVMEELSTLSFDQMMAYAPPVFGNLDDNESITLECLDADGGIIPLPADPATLGVTLPNPLVIQCRVTWTAENNRTLSRMAARAFYR